MGRNPLQRHRRGFGVEPAAHSYSAEEFVADANSGDVAIQKLLGGLFPNEVIAPLVTESFIDEINDMLVNVKKGVLVQKNAETGQIEIHDVWSIDAPPTPMEGTALAFIRHLQTGSFDKLKQCISEDCSNYHFRRGKWCSDRCGSRQRQRRWRK